MFQLHNLIVYLPELRMWNSHILTLVLFHDPVKNFCNVLENDIFLLAVQVLKGNELKRSKGTCFNLKNLIVSSKCTVNTLQLFSEKNTMLRWLIYRKWKDRKISVTLILILFSFSLSPNKVLAICVRQIYLVVFKVKNLLFILINKRSLIP